MTLKRYPDGVEEDFFAEPGDNLFINPGQRTLDVTKDLGFGLASGGFVTISEVRQSFHQVPEAATTGLLIVGLVIVSILTLRQRRKA